MTADPPGISDLRAARERLSGVAAITPLLESDLLNRAAGRRILLKAECLQRTGSFKFRGAWAHLSAQPRERLARGVVAFSSGNHAQGVAAAAELLGAPATIVMPADAPALKRSNTEAYGARVVSYDRAAGERREQVGAELVEQGDLHLVRPFDDPLVIAGQGVIGLELAEQARAAGVESAEVLVCCGGGGLSSGVALALEEAAPGMRVRPVEPAGFDDWTRSLEAGERLGNERLDGSICDALLSPEPGALTFAIGRRLFGPGLVVSDLEARKAMAAAFRHLKIVLEPGGAVSLAAALYRLDPADDSPVLLVASGGNVDIDSFRQWTNFPSWSADGLPLD